MTTAAEMSWDEIKVLVAELVVQSRESNQRLDRIELLLKRCVEKSEARNQPLYEEGRDLTEWGAMNPDSRTGYSRCLHNPKIPQIRYSDAIRDEYTERLWQKAIDDGIIDPYETDMFIDMLLEPALYALLKQLGGSSNCAFYKGGFSVSGNDGEKIFFSFLMRGGRLALAIDFQRLIEKEHVEELLAKVRQIKRLKPDFADLAIYGVVAGMAIEDDAAAAATEAGLWILAYSEPDEKVVVRNGPGFSPQVW